MTTTAFILFIIAMGEFVVIFYLLEKIRKLKTEIVRLQENLHYANGVADLAIKHRDIAEADVKLRTHGRED